MASQDEGPTPPAGEAEARLRIERLYRDAAPRLTRRLRARLGSGEEAREMLHDAFVRLLGSQRLGALRQPEAFLNRILGNLMIDRGRRGQSRPGHCPLDDDLEPSVRAEQADGLELSQMRARYEAALARLPPRTRQVFLLHRIDELGYGEIAERLAISPRTVEWHVAEAIARLARQLDEG